MAVYCAMIEEVDRGIGRVVETLKRHGQFENTMIMFLSDNGGCAELFQEDTGLAGSVAVGDVADAGRTGSAGWRYTGVEAGSGYDVQAVELPWANVSNAPFRLFKRWIHEGGISTPFIVHWPSRIAEGSIVDNVPMHITDIAATVYDAIGARYPKEYGGNEITPLEGESIVPMLDGDEWSREKPVAWSMKVTEAFGSAIGSW